MKRAKQPLRSLGGARAPGAPRAARGRATVHASAVQAHMQSTGPIVSTAIARPLRGSVPPALPLEETVVESLEQCGLKLDRLLQLTAGQTLPDGERYEEKLLLRSQADARVKPTDKEDEADDDDDDGRERAGVVWTRPMRSWAMGHAQIEPSVGDPILGLRAHLSNLARWSSVLSGFTVCPHTGPRRAPRIAR